MRPPKCTLSVKKVQQLVVSGMILLVSGAMAAPPSQEVLLRSPIEHARRFQAVVSNNPELNYLKTDPVDVQTNIDEVASFNMFFTKTLQNDVVISFKCAGERCTTFDGTSLPTVKITPFQNQTTVNFTPTNAGHDVIELEIQESQGKAPNISGDYAFVRVRVGHSTFLTVLGSIFGWVYFLCWSISFWPQNISNFKRKSVVGLNFDYTILHFTGFLFYSIFNLTLFFSSAVQEEYEEKYPRSEIPVELNDVVYSMHAAAVTSITWCQCLVYENGGQRLSIYGKLFQMIAWSIGAVLMVLAIVNVLTWLNFIYYFSYVKLLITGVKYLPQVIFNFRRKSTAGWSIWMIYLDISGGTMSMLQMLTIAYNYNDWKTLLGNLPKLGLSIASIFYDIIFLLQHFVFYPNSHTPKASQTTPGNLSRRSQPQTPLDDSLPSDHLAKPPRSSSLERKRSLRGLKRASRPPSVGTRQRSI